MKKSILPALTVLCVLISSHASAIYWEVYGPCSDKPAHGGKHQTDIKLSVGEITVEIFDFNAIPYEGTELNILSIENSPKSLEALEIISDTEMRAHGWCYSLNGTIPNQMPNHVYPQAQDDRIVWFYGSYTLKDNVWSETCVPTYQTKPAQFCAK